MIAKAIARHSRISPTKIRPVMKCVNGMATNRASFILKALNKKGAGLIDKVLKSAVSNATNKGYKEDKLYISKLVANSGSTLKRYRSASFGRASIIRKRTTHIVLELDTVDKNIKKNEKKAIKR